MVDWEFPVSSRQAPKLTLVTESTEQEGKREKGAAAEGGASCTRREQGWAGLGEPDTPLGDGAPEVFAAGVLGN